VTLSTGTVDSIYSEAGRRLGGFITALVALLLSLPVLHADETTDRLGTGHVLDARHVHPSSPRSTPR